MTWSRRSALLASVGVAVATRAAPYRWGGVDPTETIALWPAGAPGGEAVKVVEAVEEREHPEGMRDRIVRFVRAPSLTIFRPQRPSGAGLLVIPGGGYRHVVIDKEGFEAARWYNQKGVTVAVLRHRLPGDGWSDAAEVPLQDAQRAMRVLRGRAASLGIDAKRLGVTGFSAGGHVAARVSTEYANTVYTARDAADALSARPDYAVLMYPVILMRGDQVHQGSRDLLLGADQSESRRMRYSADTQVSKVTPPTLLVHAADDTSVPMENSLAMFAALRGAKVPSELHVFEEGGHGFGLRGIEGKPVAAWPELVHTWITHHV